MAGADKRNEHKGKELIDTIEPKIKRVLLYLLTYEAAITDEIQNLSDKEWEELVKIAKRHHVQEYFYYNLKQNALLSHAPKNLQKQMNDSFKRRTFENMSLVGELSRISKAFEKENIPLIALKGLHLMNDAYPHIALRYSRDLDLLIPQEKAKQAYRTLQKLNYSTKKTLMEDDFNFTYEHHLKQMFHKESRWICELHGHISEQLPININDFWKHSKKNKYPFYLFDLEDLIIHLVIHMAYNDLFKNDLRHYLDFYILLQGSRNKIDWERLVQRAKNCNCLDGMLLTFQIVSELFHVSLPASIKKSSANEAKITENIINFLWLYDKSSNEYEFFRSKNIAMTENSNLFIQMFKRIFIPPKELAYKYGQQKLSLKLYFFYIIRFFDLMRNHAKNLLQSKNDSDKQEFRMKTQEVYRYLYN